MNDGSYERYLRETVAAYDAGAERYANEVADFSRFGRLEASLNEFGERSGLAKPVLDAGSGSGRDCVHLSKRDHHVIGIDMSERLLLESRKASILAQVDITLIRADLRSIPLHDSSVSGVWCSGVLLHLGETDVLRCLHEFTRVSVPRAPTAISIRQIESEGWRVGASLEGRR